jgi:acyl carrier protein
MNPSMVETRLENYIRTQFNVSPTDPSFDREADLFENGYVDSVGVVELLGFLQEEFRVEVPDDDILSDDFSNIAGIGRIVIQNFSLQTGAPEITEKQAPLVSEGTVRPSPGQHL